MSAWLQRAFVFRWNGWTRFLRDFAVIQLGFLLFGIAIDMWVLAGIGTSPWVALEVALTYYLPITLGQSTIVVAIIIVLWLQVPYLLSGVGLMGLATALYVGVMAGAGPRDSLMLAVSRRLGISVRVARTSIEVIVVILCLLLDGTIGLGTLIIALAAGPAVQLGFRLLRVQTFKPGVVEAPSSDLV